MDTQDSGAKETTRYVDLYSVIFPGLSDSSGRVTITPYKSFTAVFAVLPRKLTSAAICGRSRAWTRKKPRKTPEAARADRALTGPNTNACCPLPSREAGSRRTAGREFAQDAASCRGRSKTAKNGNRCGMPRLPSTACKRRYLRRACSKWPSSSFKNGLNAANYPNESYLRL